MEQHCAVVGIGRVPSMHVPSLLHTVTILHNPSFQASPYRHHPVKHAEKRRKSLGKYDILVIVGKFDYLCRASDIPGNDAVMQGAIL